MYIFDPFLFLAKIVLGVVIEELTKLVYQIEQKYLNDNIYADIQKYKSHMQNININTCKITFISKCILECWNKMNIKILDGDACMIKLKM